MKINTSLQVRWLVRADMDEVLNIEHACFDAPWTEDEFLQVLRNQKCIGLVAEFERHVLGFVLYELRPHALHLLNIAVNPWEQRTGVGRAMVDKIKAKLSQQGRRELTIVCRDENLKAHLFLKACGFRCEAVLRGHFGGMDGYHFSWRVEDQE